MKKTDKNDAFIHITHTDINRDSRILKELDAICSTAKTANAKVVAIGIAEDDGNAKSNVNDEFEVVLFRSRMRYLPNIFRPIRPFLIQAELMIKLLWLAREYNPKIVHCHDNVMLPSGVVLSIWNNCKLIYDAHELESNKNGQGKVESFITNLIEKLSWRKIDLLISVSPSINKWYEDQFGSKDNILILNSPKIDDTHQINSEFNLRKKLNIPEEKKIFVYLGILDPGRGIERALSVFTKKNIDAHLLLVGWGILESSIKQHSNDYENIHFHKPVDHSKVVSLVSECDFGICNIENISLSDYLCLPNKLFEYCFAGLPVLASNFPELARVVKEHDIGITCENSENEMLKAINNLVLSEYKFTFRNIETLSWQTQAKRLADTYKKLLSI